MDRLPLLSQQKLTAGKDDLFPADATSVAPPGADCGDAAAGIKMTCKDYNFWKTFQQILTYNETKSFGVFNGTPSFSDIAQGDLGTCYFLSSIASVAFSMPKVIDNMFIKRELWAQNVYTTSWYVDGKAVEVAVDNMIPGNTSMFFVSPVRDGAWWPTILEKTYAKIYGSYKQVEGGWWENAVQSMTQAPLRKYVHKTMTEDELFAKLKEATEKGWPMGGASGPKAPKYGLVNLHTYTTLRTDMHPQFGPVIKVFNPWSSDYYKGEIPNDDLEDGIFTMTLGEYYEAFEDTTAAIVLEGYKMTRKLIQTEATAVKAWDIKITGKGPFMVVLQWPGIRMAKPMNTDCQEVAPMPILKVYRKGETVPLASTEEILPETSFLGLEMTQGPGDYTVLTTMDFDTEIAEGYLVIHSPETVTITRNPGNAEALLNGEDSWEAAGTGGSTGGGNGMGGGDDMGGGDGMGGGDDDSKVQKIQADTTTQKPGSNAATTAAGFTVAPTQNGQGGGNAAPTTTTLAASYLNGSFRALPSAAVILAIVGAVSRR